MYQRAAFLVLTLAAASQLAVATGALGQAPPVAPDPDLQAAETAMTSCAAAAVEKRHHDALAQAKVAEAAFRSRLSTRPNDIRALVGLARTIGTCRMPSAELAQMGELSAESIELLQRALEIQSDHWTARYMLALNYYRAPAFLGRAKDAAREFDLLIAQQGTRTNVPEFARPFEHRGVLWARAGELDSATAVWRRGHLLFPADTALRARLRLPLDGGDAAGSGTAPTRMEAVRVVASRTAAASVQAAPSERTLSRSQVVMTAGGMADVLLAAQLQPGATRVGDNAELFARGGDPAETPTYIDGGRVISVARFEGLSGSTFGALDPWVVRSARFSSGGFSVRHGNALSGVLDVETEGRPRHAQWRAGLGLAQGGATVRSPLGTRTGAWGTLRATHTGSLLGVHGRRSDFEGAPYSVEGMAALITQPKPGTEYRIAGMMLRDASARVVDANGYRGPFDSGGETQAVIVSSQHLVATRPMIVRTNGTASQRSTDWRFGVLSRDRTERSGIARVDAEYAAASGVSLRGGVEGGVLSREEAGTIPTSPAVAPGSPTRVLAVTDSGTWHVGGYFEGELLLGRFKVLAGTRADRLPGETDLTFDPRLSLSTPVGSWTTRFTAGQFHQGRWRAEASIPDAGTPSGVPRQARHLVAGAERDGAISVKAELFLKDYGEYGEFGAGPRVVDGRARGLDLVLQRPAGQRLSGWIGYSYLDSHVKLADGGTVRSPFDVTHTATGSATLRVARATTLGSTLRFGTGRPFTPIVGATDAGAGRSLPVYGPPTSERLPDYTRMDARITQYVPLRRTMLVTFVEVINVLDRGNIAGYVWDADYRERRATRTFYGDRTLMFGFELQSR